MNFKRKGLLKIIDLGFKNKIENLVVAFKDRLARFGFELIEYILKKTSNCAIQVLNNF